MLRIICPRCHLVFLSLDVPLEGEVVTCPRCGAAFEPGEEELYDPEND